MASSLLKFKSGQSLVEILIAFGLAAIILPTLLVGFITSRQGRPQTIQRVAASALLQQAAEALRTIREQGWDYISPNGTYNLSQSAGKWILVPGIQTANGYTQSIVIADAYRSSGVIVPAPGGAVDPSTKLVTVTVSWTTPYPSAVTSTFYLTRYLDNMAYIETTQAQFDLGNKTNVATTNDSGGEVVLSGGGHGDWCRPDLTLATVDLPKNGVANALTAIPATENPTAPGYAFAGTGDNASGVSFAKVNITDTDPPVATIPNPGTFDGYKTNAVFGETNYAYLATDNNTKEIEIINLSTNPYSQAGWFDAPGNGNGNSIFVAGNVGYMTSGNKFYTFDLSSKSGSRGLPLNNSHIVTLTGTGTQIQVIGSYAYVSIAGAAVELQIINITNSSNPSIVGQADVNGQAARGVFVNSTATRAYLVTDSSSSQRELFIIDITTKSGNQPILASYDTSGMSPRGVVAVTNNKVIIVGTGGIEYQVVNYDDINHIISSCPNGTGLLNVDTGIHGIAAVIQPSGSAYSYIITGDTASELKIIEGGPSGKSTSSGTFTSAIFDALPTTGNSQTFFNRISSTVSTPPQTTLQFQVAIADPGALGCSNADYVYVSPDANGVIPADNNGLGFENPGRCFRYRAALSTTDRSASPTLFDVTLNYSP